MNLNSREKSPSNAAPPVRNGDVEDGLGDPTEHSAREDQADNDKWELKAPDGGMKAWLALLGSWCMLFCTFGLINGTLALTCTSLILMATLNTASSHRYLSGILRRGSAQELLGQYGGVDPISADILRLLHGKTPIKPTVCLSSPLTRTT